MTEAQAVPTFTATRDVDVSRLVSERERLKQAGTDTPSLNVILLWAVAHSLTAHPRVNGAYDPAGFVVNDDVNVGMAVAVDDRLMVPVVRRADQRSIGDLAAETARLTDRVRSGKADASDLADATFTISNLGMLGVDSFTAMINVPQAAILAAGAVRNAVTFESGSVRAARRISLTITADHRIVYGADAARFLATVDEQLRLLVLADEIQ
jgi:pyruvate dehydrogenase E2 component (dihydrolipoamide acetyltransferase)